MLRDLAFQVWGSHAEMDLIDKFSVTEDLVRYMDAAMSYGGKFLIEDPTWAIDFAPNGKAIVTSLLPPKPLLTKLRYASPTE